MRPTRFAPLKSDINVTPLVDVMLVLLIIFMLVTPMLQKEIDVSLPQALNINALTDPEQRIITVTLLDNGDMFIENLQINPEKLESALLSLKQQKPWAKVHLRADRNLAYGAVKAAFRVARASGFEDAYLMATALTTTNPSDSATPSGDGAKTTKDGDL